MIIETNDKKILSPVGFQPNDNGGSAEETVINHRELLLEICDAIVEGGYNPVSQIVGYIVSEDPTHIANYKNARTLIGKIVNETIIHM